MTCHLGAIADLPESRRKAWLTGKQRMIVDCIERNGSVKNASLDLKMSENTIYKHLRKANENVSKMLSAMLL